MSPIAKGLLKANLPHGQIHLTEDFTSHQGTPKLMVKVFVSPAHQFHIHSVQSCPRAHAKAVNAPTSLMYMITF